MKIAALILMLTLAASASDLPTNPTPQYRIFDWSFVAVHGVHAGALAFDMLETSRGVGNGCAEASSNLGSRPSNGRLIGLGLAEFGGVMALDAGMKALARHEGLSRWFAVAGGSIGAAIGTAKHVHGGYLWAQTGCL